MKLECRGEKIKNKILLADKITGKNLALPVLGLLIFEAKNNKLKIKSTNLEVGVEFNIPVKVLKDGVVAVSGSIIGAFVNSIDPEETIKMELVGNNLSITTKNSSTLIKTHPVEDFPIIPKTKNKGPKITASIIVDGIKSVWFSVSTSDIKPEISSVLIYSENDHIVFAATDSFRLAEKRIKLKEFKIDPVLVPHKNALEIVRLFEGSDEDVVLGFDKGQMSIEGDGVYLTSRLTDGVYPDYKQIVPNSFKTQAVILSKDMKNSLKTANVFTDEFNKTLLKIIPEDNIIEIESKNSSVGENVISINTHTEGEGVEMGFNHKYISEVFQLISTDSVSLRFNGTNKPVLILGVGDGSFKYLVMPVNR